MANSTQGQPQGGEPRSYNGVLFLPALQLPVQRDHLAKAYGHAIKGAVDAVKPSRSATDSPLLISRLDVALLFDGGSDANRTELFTAFQKLIADLYTMVCVSASRSKIELDFPTGVDVRIFALDAPYTTSSGGSAHIQLGKSTSTAGPLSSIAAFVAARKSYDYVSCAGQKSLREDFRERNFYDFWQTSKPAGQESIEEISAPEWDDVEALHNTVTSKALAKGKSETHSRVAVGGTFDHLHIGHKLLLTATVFVAQPGQVDREVTIGITGDELLVKKKHADVLESWEVRQQRTAEFVESILVFYPDMPSTRRVEHIDNPGPNGKIVRVTYTPHAEASGTVTINYTKISDPFGPTITDESISALVISAETRAGGKAVNDKRIEKGWAPLEVFEVDVLDAGTGDDTKQQDPTATAASFESKVSSTEIRRRLASGEGQRSKS